MPRICDSSDEPHDFCKRCFPSEVTAMRRFDSTEKFGEGPDGRGNCFAYDPAHPDYDDTDYECETCGKALSNRDNDP